MWHLVGEELVLVGTYSVEDGTVVAPDGSKLGLSGFPELQSVDGQRAEVRVNLGSRCRHCGRPHDPPDTTGKQP